jgi:hypothetical protein
MVAQKAQPPLVVELVARAAVVATGEAAAQEHRAKEMQAVTELVVALLIQAAVVVAHLLLVMLLVALKAAMAGLDRLHPLPEVRLPMLEAAAVVDIPHQAAQAGQVAGVTAGILQALLVHQAPTIWAAAAAVEVLVAVEVLELAVRELWLFLIHQAIPI